MILKHKIRDVKRKKLRMQRYDILDVRSEIRSWRSEDVEQNF